MNSPPVYAFHEKRKSKDGFLKCIKKEGYERDGCN